MSDAQRREWLSRRKGWRREQSSRRGATNRAEPGMLTISKRRHAQVQAPELQAGGRLDAGGCRVRLCV